MTNPSVLRIQIRCSAHFLIMDELLVRAVPPGLIQHQQSAPRKQMIPPRPMPEPHPQWLLIQGVKMGANIPPRFPPVLQIAAAVPPFWPPISTAVDQNGPSLAPMAAWERANQTMIQNGSLANTPNPSRVAPMTMPPPETKARARRTPSDWAKCPDSHPPNGMAMASATWGMLA